MDNILKATFVLIVFLWVWFFQEENQEWDIQRNLLKDANNMGVHDAVIAGLDPEEMSYGRFIIRPSEARATFEETLRFNLGLDASLVPMPGSRVRSELRIIHFEIIDDSNTTFPYLYDNPSYRLSKWLQGPAVVAVIETDHPEIIKRTHKLNPIRVPAIYEYNPDR